MSKDKNETVVEVPQFYFDMTRCDGCVAEAQRVFTKEDQTLTLCGHHSYVNEDALSRAGWVEFSPKTVEEVLDETETPMLELEASTTPTE